MQSSWPTVVAGPPHAAVGGTAYPTAMPTTVAGPPHAAVGGTAYPTLVSAETAMGHSGRRGPRRLDVKSATF
jgi:hypothetical protein